MPGPEEECLAVARDKLAICPHTDVRTELELYVEMLRDMSADADLTGTGTGDTVEHVVPEVEDVTSRSPQPVSQSDLTVGSVGAQVGL